MLSLEMQLKVMKQARSYGETGKHVHGRGIERTNGSFSDEKPREDQNVTPDEINGQAKPSTPKP